MSRQIINQSPTPLGTAFFCPSNQEIIQKMIYMDVFKQTGMKIDRQNTDDLLSFMRTAYLSNASDFYNNIPQQLNFINKRTSQLATPLVVTGVRQHVAYIAQLDKPRIEMALPLSTNSYDSTNQPSTRIGFT